MNNLKVLHIGKYYPPYPGGIETYCKVLCEALVSQGIQTDIIVANNTKEYREETVNGVKIYRLPRTILLSSIPVCLKLFSVLLKLIENNKYDAIHLHFPNPIAEIAYLLLGKGKKLIVTYHTDAGLRHKLKILYLPVVRKLFKSATHIIVFFEHYLATDFNPSRKLLASFKEKCRFIPIPVGNRFFSPINTECVNNIRRKYGRFILFVGNLSSYKGESFLINAMKTVDCKLLLAGSGASIDNFKKIIHDLGFEKKIIFLGHVDNTSLKDYYDACDIFCLPSISSLETFPVVTLEAMARSKPVVTTEIGTGSSYININKETGLVVPPKSSDELANALNIILNNDSLKQQMGSNAHKRIIENFTLEKVINSIIDLYKN